MLNIKCRKHLFLEDGDVLTAPVFKTNEKNKIKKRFPALRNHTSDKKFTHPSNFKKKNEFSTKKIIITTSSRNTRDHEWIRPESSENEKDYTSGSGNPVIYISKLSLTCR